MAKGPFKRTEGFVKSRRTDHIPGNAAIFEKRGDSWSDPPPKEPTLPPVMGVAAKLIEAHRRRAHRRTDIPQFKHDGPKPVLPSKFTALERKGMINKDEPVYHPVLALRAKSHKTHEVECLSKEDRNARIARAETHRLKRAQARQAAIKEKVSQKDYFEVKDDGRQHTSIRRGDGKWQRLD